MRAPGGRAAAAKDAAAGLAWLVDHCQAASGWQTLLMLVLVTIWLALHGAGMPAGTTWAQLTWAKLWDPVPASLHDRLFLGDKLGFVGFADGSSCAGRPTAFVAGLLTFN